MDRWSHKKVDGSVSIEQFCTAGRSRQVSRALACVALISLPHLGLASVVTTGCADANFCTLDELYAGGAISINDVTFNGAFLNDNFGGLDATTVKVLGVDETALGGSSSSLGLTFEALSPLSFEFLEYDFDIMAQVATAGRSFVGAELTLASTDVEIVGDAFAEVNAVFASTLFQVMDGVPADANTFSNETGGLIDFDIQMEAFDAFSSASLDRFDFMFTVDTQAVSEPITWSLAALGLMGLWGGRVKRRQL